MTPAETVARVQREHEYDVVLPAGHWHYIPACTCGWTGDSADDHDVHVAAEVVAALGLREELREVSYRIETATHRRYVTDWQEVGE